MRQCGRWQQTDIGVVVIRCAYLDFSMTCERWARRRALSLIRSSSAARGEWLLPGAMSAI